MVIKRIGVLKLAVFQACMSAALGLIGALFFVMFGSMFAGLSGHAGAAGMIGISAIIIFPVMYGVFGFIFGAIAAALYNLIAGIVGGIEIETE